MPVKQLATRVLPCQSFEPHGTTSDSVAHVPAAATLDVEAGDDFVGATVHVLAVEVLHLVVLQQLAGRISRRVAHYAPDRLARVLVAHVVSGAPGSGDRELTDCVVGGARKVMPIEVLRLLVLQKIAARHLRDRCAQTYGVIYR